MDQQSGHHSMCSSQLCLLCLFVSLQRLPGKEELQGNGGREEPSSDQDPGPVPWASRAEELTKAEVRMIL